ELTLFLVVIEKDTCEVLKQISPQIEPLVEDVEKGRKVVKLPNLGVQQPPERGHDEGGSHPVPASVGHDALDRLLALAEIIKVAPPHENRGLVVTIDFVLVGCVIVRRQIAQLHFPGPL